MPTLKINGKEITVEPGTTIMQAADMLGIHIPRFCYHKELPIAGNCRMCLVEIEKNPKLQISCNTAVADGMVVQTDTPQVREAVRGVLEFILINHPIDCPVCDQAGECWLQNYYMRFGLYSSRFNLEDKVHKPKRVDLGPIVLDAERCVLCSRCVRFCSEVTKTGEMEIFERGDHSEIRTYQGEKLDKNKYAGNLVDICPVGALTSRDFRFRCRAWFLKTAESICPGCANGCNIYVHYGAPRYVNFENVKIYRLMPRYNPDVNRSWLCDAGRLSYKLANSPTRLTTPAVRPRWTPVGREPYIPEEEDVKEDTSLSPVLAGYYGTGWNEALGYIASEIKKVIVESGGDAVAAIASSRLTNEDLFVLKKFMHGIIGSRHLDYRVTLRLKGDEDNFLIKSDKTPNSRGAEEILLKPGYNGLTVQGILDAIMGNKIKALLVIGQDLYRADVHWDLVQMALHAMEMTVVMNGNLNMTVSLARVQLPMVSFAETEGTYTNHAGRVQRLYPALTPKEKAKPAWQALVELSAALGKELPYRSAEEVFTGIAKEVPAYKGLSYEKIGSQGAMIAK